MEITLRFQEFFLRHNRNLVAIDDLVEHLSTFQKIIYLIAEEKRPSINNAGDIFSVLEIRFWNDIQD